MKTPTDTCTINVTNFPISMRKELKIIAAQQERLTIREVLIKAARMYLNTIGNE